MNTSPSAIIERAAEKLENGGSFSTFAKESQPAWSRLALRLRKRSGYTSVELDDLVQVMLWEAYLASVSFDRNRGKLYDRIMYCSMTAAQRAVLEGKGLLGRLRDSSINSPGRVFPLMSPETKGEPYCGDAPAGPEEIATTRERVGMYLHHATPRDRVLVMEALKWGSIQLGASELAKDAALCERLNLRSEDLKWTQRVVRRAVVRTINRVESTEDS